MTWRVAWIVVAAVAFPCLSFAQDRPAQKPDAEAIQGEWQIIHFEADGEVESPEKFKAMTYVFAVGKASIKKDGKVVVEFTFRLDPSKRPKHIDLLKPGEKDGPGIYELDGDNLTICLPDTETETERAKEFKTQKGSRAMLMKLERVKK